MNIYIFLSPEALIGDQELRDILHREFQTKNKGSLAAVFEALWLRKECATVMAHLQEYLNPVPVPGTNLNRNTIYMSDMFIHVKF